MMNVFMELASLVLILACFITGFLVLLIGLILVCVDTCCFCWKRVFRRGRIYRA